MTATEAPIQASENFQFKLTTPEMNSDHFQVPFTVGYRLQFVLPIRKVDKVVADYKHVSVLQKSSLKINRRAPNAASRRRGERVRSQLERHVHRDRNAWRVRTDGENGWHCTFLTNTLLNYC